MRFLYYYLLTGCPSSPQLLARVPSKLAAVVTVSPHGPGPLLALADLFELQTFRLSLWMDEVGPAAGSWTGRYAFQTDARKGRCGRVRRGRAGFECVGTPRVVVPVLQPCADVLLHSRALQSPQAPHRGATCPPPFPPRAGGRADGWSPGREAGGFGGSAGQPLVGFDLREVRLCRFCRLHCHARCWIMGEEVCLRCHVQRRAGAGTR